MVRNARKGSRETPTAGGSTTRDPRPHIGEPLPLDLLNTRWASPSGPQDLLGDSAGVECWLTVNGLIERCTADDKTRKALAFTRDAMQRAISGETVADLNSVLERGRLRRSLTGSEPTTEADVAEPEWLAGWLAADALLDLLEEAPERIKQCAHPQCVLWFYDTSKNGRRRWHSMATCGNRAKAARHYAAKNVTSPSG